MQLGSMFISNCNNALHVSDAICVHPQEHLETVVAASGVMRTVWRRELTLSPPHSKHYRHTKHMLPHNHDG